MTEQHNVRVRHLQKGDKLVATGETVTDVWRDPYDSKKYIVNLTGRTYRSVWNANTSIRVERSQ